MIAASIILTLGGALALSLGLTRLMIWLGPRLGLLDLPGVRRIHSQPVPRSGGIAVWVAFLSIGLLVLIALPLPGTLNWGWFRAFAVASGLLVLVGFADDRWGLSAWVKLAGQVGVAVLLFFSRGKGVGHFLGFDVHWSLDLLVWVVWTVGIINAFNLIDGLDGLCGGMALISVGALVVVSFVSGRVLDGIMMVAMLGAIGGFLRYNIHPARIVLGETGSMLLGFFLASAATVSAGERAVTASLLIPILVAGVPFIDVILALWRRSARKWLAQLGLGHSVNVFGSDKDHLHHRLLKLGLTQRKVALLFYLAAIFASAVAILPLLLGGQAAGFAVTAVVVGAIVGLRYIAPIELSTSGKVLHLALTRPVGSRLMVLGYICFDALAILLALAVALMVESSGGFAWLHREDLPVVIAVTMGCGLSGLRMAKAYSRHWARASMRDYWALALWFGVAMHIAFTIMMLLARDPAWASGRVFLMTTTFAVPALLLPRSVTPLIRESLIDSRHRRLISSRSRQKRILLYGAGDLGELFLSHLKTAAPTEMEEMCIVGFIDDRPRLRRKILDGFRIRGSVQHLAALADRYELHGVLLTVSRIEPHAAAELNRICDEKGLALYRWRPQLHFREIAPQDLGADERIAVGSDVFRGPGAPHPAPEVVAVPLS